MIASITDLCLPLTVYIFKRLEMFLNSNIFATPLLVNTDLRRVSDTQDMFSCAGVILYALNKGAA